MPGLDSAHGISGDDEWHSGRGAMARSSRPLAPSIQECMTTRSSESDVLDRFALIAAQVHNEGGSKRVVVTKPLPGDRWLQILTAADCRVEVAQHEDTILSNKLVKDLIGKQCDGVIGQLTEVRCGALRAAAVRVSVRAAVPNDRGRLTHGVRLCTATLETLCPYIPEETCCCKRNRRLSADLPTASCSCLHTSC